MNWFTRLFSKPEPAPQPVFVPPPKPMPVISCFVKGLIRSMRETPHEWKLGRETAWHTKPDGTVDITLDNSCYYAESYLGREAVYLGWRVVGYEINGWEKYAIRDEGIAFLKDIEKKVEDAAYAKRKEDLAALRAPFERLGCQ
jgi:hypothetical protein